MAKSDKPEPPAPPRPAPPWGNFQPAPIDPRASAAKAAEEARKAAASVVVAEGFSRYRARRDNGSGKYRQGRVYILPRGQSPLLFEEIPGE